MAGPEGIWYRMGEPYDPDALDRRSNIRKRSFESRTIISPPSAGDALAWSITSALPPPDRKELYQRIRSGNHLEDTIYFSNGRGYHFLDSSDLRSILSLQELFYLPFVGVYGRPTEILNASRSFSNTLGDEGRLIAILHEVPYTDITRESEPSIIHGSLDA